MFIKNNRPLWLGLGSMLVLSACGGSGNKETVTETEEEAMAEYEITIVNATAAQPLSPLTVSLHNSDTKLWKIGSAASVEIEQMAEAGDNTGLLTLLSDSYDVKSGEGIIMPGASETVYLSAKEMDRLYFSAASMPVNTNDAFTGVTGVEVGKLSQGESMMWRLPLYDAGTEYNSELAGTIPGPADGGEGFNANRDDVMNKISRHPGLVTQADDNNSVLSAEHRIAGAVATLTLTRVQ